MIDADVNFSASDASDFTRGGESNVEDDSDWDLLWGLGFEVRRWGLGFRVEGLFFFDFFFFFFFWRLFFFCFWVLSLGASSNFY